MTVLTVPFLVIGVASQYTRPGPAASRPAQQDDGIRPESTSRPAGEPA
jgi:hypothetical protein